MTSQDPAETFPPTTEQAVLLHRFNKIMAATGIEPARTPQQGADGVLVDPHEEYRTVGREHFDRAHHLSPEDPCFSFRSR